MDNIAKSQLLASLTQSDYEEAALAAEYFALSENVQAHLYDRAKAKKLSKAQETESTARMKVICEMLGYDPDRGRASRSRGRVRQQAMPRVLPPIGTELQSCVGDTYKVEGYYGAARDVKYTHVLYRDAEQKLVGRTIASLLCGHLASGVAIVTWPGDERGTNAVTMKLPLNRRRTLTRRELMMDEHADPDTLPMSAAEKKRRY